MADAPVGEEELLAALFMESLPDQLSNDMLALAHLSDVDEEEAEEQSAGPVRRTRTKQRANPYATRSKKTEEDKWADEIKELDFRARAWKPFSTVSGKNK